LTATKEKVSLFLERKELRHHDASCLQMDEKQLIMTHLGDK